MHGCKIESYSNKNIFIAGNSKKVQIIIITIFIVFIIVVNTIIIFLLETIT